MLMGVSGSGKSTVGKLLAARLGWEFHDGDDLHSEDSVRKMASGIPLTDDDRWPWLERIGQVMEQCDRAGHNAVIACSALRRVYRDDLRQRSFDVRFVYLRSDRINILERLRKRVDHFMPETLLDSQFATLEEPHKAITVDAMRSPEDLVDIIVRSLSLSSR